MTPTQRTLKHLKDQGYKCAIVEKWNAFAARGDGRRGIRVDLWGFIDILYLDPLRGVMAVQSTGTDFAGHHKKLTEEKAQDCIDWLSVPGTALFLYGWRKVKVKRGGKAEHYEPRIREYTLLDFGFSPLWEPVKQDMEDDFIEESCECSCEYWNGYSCTK